MARSSRRITLAEAERWRALSANFTVIETEQTVYGEGYVKLAVLSSSRARCLACGERFEDGVVLAVVTSAHGGWTWVTRYLHRTAADCAATEPPDERARARRRDAPVDRRDVDVRMRLGERRAAGGLPQLLLWATARRTRTGAAR
jgi:hypothetical protein